MNKEVLGKNKKKVIILISVMIFIFTFCFSRYQYEIYKINRNAAYVEIYPVVKALSDTSDISTKYPFANDMSFEISMDGSTGLYIKSMAYQYFTGNTVDYWNIMELKKEEKIMEIREKYKDFIDWVNDHETEIANYYYGVLRASDINDNISWDSDYRCYKKVIAERPEKIESYLRNKGSSL